LFVLKLDAANAKVIVGPRSALAARAIILREVNWLGAHDRPFPARVKVRSMRPPVAALVTPLSAGRAKVELDLPEDSIAPGQACVFYQQDGSRVLGGGWIASNSEEAAAAA
jgi:tRNA-specific 2-thiouridylase